jgi:hypothetical protein
MMILQTGYTFISSSTITGSCCKLEQEWNIGNSLVFWLLLQITANVNATGSIWQYGVDIFGSTNRFNSEIQFKHNTENCLAPVGKGYNTTNMCCCNRYNCYHSHRHKCSGFDYNVDGGAFQSSAFQGYCRCLPFTVRRTDITS